MKDVDQLRRIGIGRHKKAFLLDGMANHSNISALQLLIVLIPELCVTGLRLDPLLGLKSVEILDVALGLVTLLLLPASR
ncbi:hypothetical protein P5E99_15970, partial [Clostridium perfringens]|nr:hypothetical protein [Clostridium perfringens]